MHLVAGIYADIELAAGPEISHGFRELGIGDLCRRKKREYILEREQNILRSGVATLLPRRKRCRAHGAGPALC